MYGKGHIATQFATLSNLPHIKYIIQLRLLQNAHNKYDTYDIYIFIPKRAYLRWIMTFADF